MKKTLILTSLVLSGLIITSCSSDDNGSSSTSDFVVAFESPSISFDPTDTEKSIRLTFSRAASEDGLITIKLTPQDAVYGEDFYTTPESAGDEIKISVNEGTHNTSFTFHKLQNPLEGEDKSVNFEITNISNGYAQGTTSTLISLTESAALGGSSAPEVGGVNQPNQVYVDLSSQNETTVRRDSWDLGFFSGSEFKVSLNGSLYMAAAQLNFTDINAVTEAEVANLMGVVAVGTFDPNNMVYIDSPDGNINETAIDAISSNDNENKVYLLNLGFEISTDVPNPGSVAIAGEHRGWKKIRILRSGENYILQYANLNDTSYQTATISKNTAYNFSFFSLNTNNTVSVEPVKEKWDLNFTVFTNEIEGYGSYGYPDFVASNRKSNVSGYMVNISQISYENFTATHLNESNFEIDQRFIGSNWRVGGGPDNPPYVDETVFFIVKDIDGNVYKLRFTAMLNENGVRGYPVFEYSLL